MPEPPRLGARGTSASASRACVANDRVSLKLYRRARSTAWWARTAAASRRSSRCCPARTSPIGGRILRGGEPVVAARPDRRAARPASPRCSRSSRSCRPLTVAENIYLGRWPRRRGRDRLAAPCATGAQRVLAAMDVAIDPDAVVGDALGRRAAARRDRQGARRRRHHAHPRRADDRAGPRRRSPRLHGLLRRLRGTGAAILYISHRLDEVVDLVDAVTVLKDGQGRQPAAETRASMSPSSSRRWSATWASTTRRSATRPTEAAARGAQRHHAREPACARSASTVRARRGASASAACSARAAPRSPARSSGSTGCWRARCSCSGKPAQLRGPRATRSRAGIALVPENRKTDGLFFNFTGFPNITIASLAQARTARAHLVSRASARRDGG